MSTSNQASITITNQTGQTLQNVTVVYKRNGKLIHQLEFKGPILMGSTTAPHEQAIDCSTAPLKKRRDRWGVSWTTEDGVLSVAAPKNRKKTLNTMTNIKSKLSSVVGTLTGGSKSFLGNVVNSALGATSGTALSLYEGLSAKGMVLHNLQRGDDLDIILRVDSVELSTPSDRSVTSVSIVQ